MTEIIISQRKDYTHKFNNTNGRHGWLRLTPAYSVKLVHEVLSKRKGKINVLDPFSGSATTLLCAGNLGYLSTGIEINPFLVWLGRCKTRIYNDEDIVFTFKLWKRIKENIEKKITAPIPIPPLYNIERWWHKNDLNYLCLLKGSIDNEIRDDSPAKDLLLISFCRLMIKISNAAFNHQSMSFKDSSQRNLRAYGNSEHELSNMFETELNYIIQTAKNNPKVSAKIVSGDSKKMSSLVENSFDMIVTSPPYPNRMSYIRELRPYMYWLGYLQKPRDAGELDWSTIGGTWGIATSRLSKWNNNNGWERPDYINRILNEIAAPNNKNGKLLSNYIAKYFEDIWIHVENIPKVVTSDCEFHYIVGNSTFYRHIVPVEEIYKDMFEKIGVKKVEIQIIRKRNSKKELFEFDIHGNIAN